jgi:hypothetical protein
MAKLYGVDTVVQPYDVLPHTRISGPLGALSNERGKDLGPDLVRVEWFRSKAEFSSPPQPQHLGREAEMSQLQVFQL